MSSQFVVGLKMRGKTDHVIVEAEDALIAALRWREGFGIEPSGERAFAAPENVVLEDIDTWGIAAALAVHAVGP